MSQTTTRHCPLEVVERSGGGHDLRLCRLNFLRESVENMTPSGREGGMILGGRVGKGWDLVREKGKRGNG